MCKCAIEAHDPVAWRNARIDATARRVGTLLVLKLGSLGTVGVSKDITCAPCHQTSLLHLINWILSLMDFKEEGMLTRVLSFICFIFQNKLYYV